MAAAAGSPDRAGEQRVTLMTIFDWLDRLAFLRGETAAWLVVLTAVLIVVVPDLRLKLLALAGQYFAAALLFVDVLDPRLAIVKLLVGWFVCLILYMTGRQVNWDRPPEDVTVEEARRWRAPKQVSLGRYRLPVWAVRAALSGLTLLLVWWLARQPSVYLPLAAEDAAYESVAYMNLAVYGLLAFGLLQMALAARPLAGGMGIFMFLTGFALFYSSLDQSLVGLGLLAAVNLAMALGVSYLAQSRRVLIVNSQ